MSTKATSLTWLVLGLGAIGFGVGITAVDWTPKVVAAPAPPPPPDAGVSAPEPPPPEFIGVVLSGYAVDITPKGEGKVEAVYFHAGDRVAAGAPLAAVDLTKTQKELASAEADLAAAIADEHDAEQKWRRRIPLGGAAVSREEVESARAQAQMARAKVASRRAQVAQLQIALKEAEVRAPFDGVVATRYVDPGAVAGPGRPVLRLIGESDPQVRFAAPTEFAEQLHAGVELRVALSSPQAVLAGRIDHVTPEVDPGSHMLFAVGKVKIPPALAKRLSSGIVARVSLATARAARPEARPAGAAVSSSALLFEPDPLTLTAGHSDLP